MKNRINRLFVRLFVATLAVVGFVFANGFLSFAEEKADIVIDSCLVSDNGDNDYINFQYQLNSADITAVVYQLIDSQGNTVCIKTARAYGIGGDSNYFGPFSLDEGDYTLVISDYNGACEPAETTVKVTDEPRIYMNLQINFDTTAMIPMYIPNKYKKLVIDGVEMDLNSTETYTNGKVSFVREGSTRNYIYRKQVAAKEFDDEISICLYEDNETPIMGGDDENAYMFTYSVRKYLSEKMENSTDPDYALYKALNDFGYASQTLFNYNAPKTPVEIAEAGDLSSYKSTIVGEEPDGLEYVGTSLVIDGYFTIRHYFKGDCSDIIAAINGDNNNDYRISLHQIGNYCYVDIKNVNASKLATPFELVMWHPSVSGNGYTGYRIQNYSVLSYCEKVLANSGSSPELANVAKAIVQFQKAVAKVYSN